MRSERREEKRGKITDAYRGREKAQHNNYNNKAREHTKKTEINSK